MSKLRPVTIDDYVLLTYIKTDELTGDMTEIKMLKQRPKRVTFDVQFDLDQSNLINLESVGELSWMEQCAKELNETTIIT